MLNYGILKVSTCINIIKRSNGFQWGPHLLADLCHALFQSHPAKQQLSQGGPGHRTTRLQLPQHALCLALGLSHQKLFGEPLRSVGMRMAVSGQFSAVDTHMYIHYLFICMCIYILYNIYIYIIISIYIYGISVTHHHNSSY